MSSPFPNGYALIPLAWISAAAAFGIFVASFVSFSIVVLASFVPLAVGIRMITGGRRFAFTFTLAAAAATGALAYEIEKANVSEDRVKVLIESGQITSGEPAEIVGSLVGSPEPAPDGAFLLIDSEEIIVRGKGIKASGRVRASVNLRGDAAKEEFDGLRLSSGTMVSISSPLMREDAYLNPGVMLRTQILDQQGIDATISVKSPLLIEKISAPAALHPLGWVYEQRSRLIDTIQSTFSRQTAGILIAATLGNKYFLDKRTADTFREGGTFHILVISGLHITFIGGLILLAVRRFSRNPSIQFIVSIAVLWAYTLAVGAEPPVVRASLMFTVILLGYVLDRQVSALNSLGCCILILLAWRPSELFNPSLQLTIVSVAAIIGIALPLISKLREIGSWTPSAERPFPPNVPQWLNRAAETFYWNRAAWDINIKSEVWSAKLFKSPFLGNSISGAVQRALAYGVEAILVSATVQICLLPLLIYYFHRISPSSVLLNIWIGILLAAKSIIAGVAMLVASISSIAAMPLVTATEMLNELMFLFPQFILSYDNASLRIPVYSGELRWIYLLYLILVAAFGALLAKWRPFDPRPKAERWKRSLFVSSGLAVVVFASVLIFHPFSEPRVDGNLRIDFLDVGQGDSALITFPNGETMLIDGGGRVNFSRVDDGEEEAFEPDVARVGEIVVSEFLWERGYSSIDHIILSHAHADHTQGLVDVASNFAIGKAYFAESHMPSEDSLELAGILGKRRVGSIFLRRGDQFSISGVLIDVLHPSIDATSSNYSENDRSLVLLFTFGEQRFLFTGDIEQNGEEDLVRLGVLGSVDLVKVPHHGSRTSSTDAFVELTRPKIAVIPVGRRSRFGHPHQEIVERWQKSGATIMVTGERGTLNIIADGRELLEAKTYK